MQRLTPCKRSGGAAVGLARATSGEPVTVPPSHDDNCDIITPSYCAGCTTRSPTYGPECARSCGISSGLSEPAHLLHHHGPSGMEDWFLSWLLYILVQSSIPQTISISTRRTTRKVMQHTCAPCTRSSARVAPALSPGAVTTASEGTASTDPEKSSSCPPFPHPVSVAIFLGLRAAHKHGYRWFTTPPRFRGSLGH